MTSSVPIEARQVIFKKWSLEVTVSLCCFFFQSLC